MNKIYEEFNDVEEEIKQVIQPILYKYRCWNDKNHREMITDSIIWFTHPKNLNDQNDIRVPVRFDYSEVYHPAFFQKLKLYAQSIYYWIDPKSREFNTICENQLQIIKLDPKTYFKQNYLKLRDSNIYDQVGVFSLSKNPLNENMWAHYSCNAEGFCVGFDSLELLRRLQLKFGFVHYEIHPPLHSFIKDFNENQEDEMFLKNIKWTEEEEFRILTLNIKIAKDRKIQIADSIIKEIIIGNKMNDTYLNEIKNLLKIKYKSSVKLFKIEPIAFNYGFVKTEIAY